ncbi:YqaJ viral recombinase family nuclease [Ralstonia syzygii]|uniref:YqaJ viral recombinase family nuclease n=1 Tax=Ralstonia syzygii TaxID=28097 RepID=UPI0018D0864D|nr:YqaJ viral recombinase family protein [Ralstonia syzygii]
MNTSARNEFLTARQTGIGGSDIGAILGVSPFKTAVDVYLAKTRPNPSDERSELTYWGHAVEPIIINRFSEDHGINVVKPDAIARHADHQWMVANLDGIIPGDRPGVLEIKNVSQFGTKAWGAEGTDEVPLSYVAQVAWYMAVMGYDYGVIAALFGGNDYREFRVERDAELEAMLINTGRDFWLNHVITGTPPEAKTASDVLRLFKRDDGSATEADDELFDLCEQLKTAKAEGKRVEGDIDLIETKIKARMGDAATLIYHGQTLATWKTQTARRFDTKAFEAAHPALCDQFRKVSESRVFRLK